MSKSWNDPGNEVIPYAEQKCKIYSKKTGHELATNQAEQTAYLKSFV